MSNLQPSMRHSRTQRRIAGRAQRDDVIDPYQARQKPKEPSVCRDCGAVYHRGRWQWGRPPAAAPEELCPACRRIRDRLPAGILVIDGGLARDHADEIEALARNQEAAENGEHPLNRIVDIAKTESGLTITTTDVHLPRRIGTALKRAYRGTLAMHFDATGYFLRAEWRSPS